MLDPATAGTVIGEEQDGHTPALADGGGRPGRDPGRRRRVAWLKPWQHPPERVAARPLPEKPSIAVLPFENVERRCPARVFR